MTKQPQRLLPDIEGKLQAASPYDYHAMRQELLQKLLKEIDEPEGKVRYAWVQKLIHEYNYDSRQIEIEVPAGIEVDPNKPVRAGIVVYRDFERTEAITEGEVEPQGQKEDIAKAEGYARNLGAEYYFWSDGIEVEYFRTSPYPRKSTPVGNIPYWFEKKPVHAKLSKKHILRPFKNEQELRSVMASCHDSIWAKEGHDPAKAFDELCKLLFLKLYDERESHDFYEFVVLGDDKPVDTAKRIRELFDKAKTSYRYRDVFESKFTKPDNIFLELDDFTIWQVVQQLQSYNLVETTENIKGADIKGYIFEEMVGNTFRGELGQFFTPRTIIEFMVKMLNPSENDRIIDPACGSSGFLIMTIRYVKDIIKREMPNLDFSEIKDKIRFFAEHNLFGTDINDRMARVAKMNMIMHGDGHSGIFNVNGLYVNADASARAKNEIREGSFQIAFSNPPFAGYEKDPDILRKFELGKKKGKPRAVTKEVLFIERIINLLDYDGKAALVLPQGIFSNASLKYVRDLIKQKCKILAIVALPIWAFRPSGTGVRGSLLFLQKGAKQEPEEKAQQAPKVPEDYNIFIKEVEHIGFDSTGKHDTNDLDLILDAYKKGNNPDDWITFKELDNCMGYTKTGRLDARFFLKETRNLLSFFKDSPYPLQKISDIADFSDESYSAKPDEELKYIEVNDINVKTGKIRKRTRKGKNMTQGTIKIHEGQILVSRRWPDRGAIAIVPKEFEGALLVREVSALTIKPKNNREYFYYLFRTRPFLDLMDVYTSGEMSHRISETDLKNIEIPVPNSDTQNKIVASILEKKEEADSLRRQAEDKEEEAKQQLFNELKLKPVSEKIQSERLTYKRV